MKTEDKHKRIAAYWNERSPLFDEEHDTEDISLWSRELEKVIGLSGEGKILDVGTGTGFLALMLGQLGYEVTGIDLAEKMLELGRKKAGQMELSIVFMQSSCEQLPFPDNSFDAVVNCRVMWTLPEPVQALKEWKRVLKPGGKVISFMRMMPIDSAADYYGEDVELPLRKGERKDYVAAYETAGLTEIAVTELPAQMSRAEDMPSWTMFTGRKAVEEG